MAYGYQKRENDAVCLQFKSRQVPAETPDIELGKDDNDYIYLNVGGKEVYSKYAGAAATASTTEELLEDIKTTGSIVVTADIEVSAADLEAALTDTESGTISISTGDNTLTITGNTNIDLGACDSFTISGNVEANDLSSTKALFDVKDGCEFTAKDLTATVSGLFVQPEADDTITLENCNITTTGGYVVATNSISSEAGSTITIKDCTFSSEAADGDSAVVMINAADTCTITGSTINGRRQAIIARAGTVTISDSTINNNIVYTGGVSRCTAPLKWSSGNEVAYGALVCGTNSSSNGYKADAIVNVSNSTLTCTIDESAQGTVADKYAYALYAIGDLNPRTDGGEGNYQTTIAFNNVTYDGEIFIGGTTLDPDIDAEGSVVTFTIDGLPYDVEGADAGVSDIAVETLAATEATTTKKRRSKSTTVEEEATE